MKQKYVDNETIIPRRPLAMLYFGLLMLYVISFETDFQRLKLDVQGTVISASSAPYVGAPRYSTAYVLRSDNGNIFTYTAGPTDASLNRGLPLGTHIKKIRWRFGYWLDGKWQSFPIVADLCTTFFAAIMSSIGAFQLIRWQIQKRFIKPSLE